MRRLRFALASLIVASLLGLVANAQWNEQVLYSLQGIPDGKLPAGRIVFDSAGNIYGATTQGGSKSCRTLGDCGTVYQLSPPAHNGDPWTETVLYVFKGNASNDGATPAGGLLIDASGNLYGTTAYGGTGACTLLGSRLGCGTVFELSPPLRRGGAWTETILYSFPDSAHGYLPIGDLMFDAAGNLYGATEFGGGHGSTCNPYYQYCGAVFQLIRPRQNGHPWAEKVLHGFAGGIDGANPNGGLSLDSKGAIYGTTYSGGNQKCKYLSEIGCGTAFQLVPPKKKREGWTEVVLHRFDRTNSDGGNPMAGVILDSHGKLYGTTLNGGPKAGGIVFRLTRPAKKSDPWLEAILNSFGNNAYGYDLESPVLMGTNGTLYGTTNTGSGQAINGGVFQLKRPSRKGQRWKLDVLYNFAGAPDGVGPAAPLISDPAGNLYSTTQSGGTGNCLFGCGTIFELGPP
jgi:hypothetical protein